MKYKVGSDSSRVPRITILGLVKFRQQLVDLEQPLSGQRDFLGSERQHPFISQFFVGWTKQFRNVRPEFFPEIVGFDFP